jgi:predicted dinucleotide-binding enzyme
MKIGIIGAGHIGGALTRRFRALGHEVFVANSRGPETLADLATETGATAVTVHEAARAGEVVVVTIPVKNIPQLPDDLFAGVPDSVVVVDTGNYYPQRDGRIPEIESGTTESRWTSQQIGRPVIKAFNNIYAQHLLEMGRPERSAGRIALPVAGDDKAAKAVVLKLVDELGFDGIDAGGLDDSWRQQPGTPVYATDFDADGVRRALSLAKPDRLPQFRAPAESDAPVPAARRNDSGPGEPPRATA